MQATIRAAFDADFANFSSPGMGDLVFEGQTYVPEETTPYIITEMSSYTRSPVGYGADSAYQESGTYQVMVMRPASEGIVKAAYLADQVVLFYPRTKGIVTATNQTLSLLSASAMRAIKSADWIQIPVVVSWFGTDP